MIQTSYGRKKPGCSPFVVIAPHGAGDDKKTGVIANRLAKKLNGFLVVNKKYIKSDNSRAHKYPEKIEDFNELCWGHSYNKYLWKRKRPEMKLFYKDVDAYCKEAKKINPFKKAIAIYIHGMNSNEIGIDIGVGAKKFVHTDTIYGAKAYRFFRKNYGKITLKISLIKKIKDDLQKKLAKDRELKVTIGGHYSGWSRQSAIQFHKHGGRNDYAMQFEISHLFRQKYSEINYIVETLGNALQQTFES